MSTHDIKLPEPKYPGTKADIPNAIPDLYTADQLRAAIEADRKHRGEPVAWMPVETAPEEGCWALVCGEGAMDCMFIRKGHVPENWTNPNNPNLNPSEVTHWMPIPKFAPQPSEPQECGCCGRSDGCDPDCDVVQPADPLKVPSDDVLADALTNLEHDNYEKSYSGYKNRQADIELIRAALTAMGSGNPSGEIQAVHVDQTKSSRRERLMSDPKRAEALKRAKKRIEEHPVVKQYRVDTKHQNSE